MRNFTPRVPRWALWISSAVTFFAAAMLVFAIVLGIRAGQEQLTIKHRQQVSMILEQAFSYHNQGQLEAARIAYEEVLLLDPDNSAATEGLSHVRAISQSGGAGQAAPLPALAAPVAVAANATVTNSDTAVPVVPFPSPTTASAPSPTTSSATTTSSSGTSSSGTSSTVTAPTTTAPGRETSALATLTAAEADVAAGRWSAAVDQLVALQRADPTFQQAKVTELLVEAYMNLAYYSDNQNRFQEAVDFFDKALELEPNAPNIRAERALVANYLDAVTYAAVDPAQAITALQTIYRTEPSYRDVEERLQAALLDQSERLAADEAWCDAAELLNDSIAIGITPGVVLQRDEYQEACETDGASLAERASPPTEGDADDEATADSSSTPTPTTERPSAGGNTNPGALSSGTILYSALDATTGRSRIMAQDVGSSAAATVLREDAAQPALRGDGVRLLYRNLRNDMAGLSAWDVNSDLLLRFTTYAEDALPSWNPQGNRFVFASNREGDRLWRVYVSWAESGSEATTLNFGEAPAWHPSADQIVYRGCDNTGNRCGLWLINSSGSGSAPLTTVSADTRPAWTPDGSAVVFMSNERDGNFELYQVDTGTQAVIQLTDNSAADLLPTVSPDGRWVAFVSNRGGAWEIWGVPVGGGSAERIAPLTGNLGSWTEHAMQWVP